MSQAEREKNQREDKGKEEEEKREGTRSRSSSTSSEDYIIILPDCFDTSRPLGESMYRYVTRGAVQFSFIFLILRYGDVEGVGCHSLPFPIAALLYPSLVTSQQGAPQTQKPPLLTTLLRAPQRGSLVRWRRRRQRLQGQACRAPAAPTTCSVRLRRWTMSR